MKKISAVVPIAKWDFKRSTILFKSLNKFFDPLSMDKIYIFYPDKEKMNTFLNSINFSLNYVVMTEKELIPIEDYKLFEKRKGWYRQQIIKLYISKIIKTRFYICLDADIICIKPTTYSSLIKDDRPNINIEPKSLFQKWWLAALKVLKVDDPGTIEGMCSSTQIFITQEVLNLIDYIELIYGKSFIKTMLNWIWINFYFFRVFWTEYKLYWTFIEYRNLTNSYYYDDVVWSKGIWSHYNGIDDDFLLLKTILDKNNKGYFSICQSTMTSEEIVLNKISEILEL